ncbi:MAG TPA: hypothetical protein VFZ20_26420 [Longimicrobium sp.]|nr:hypothetical protein [Longimicrobium sp.]
MSLLGRVADGVLGARVPAAELPYPVPPGVTVRRGRLMTRLGGWFMGGSRRAAGAVTLGRTIVCNADLPITDDLIVHELVHVEQWRDPLFAVRYVAGWIRHGYRNNPYEEEAYRRQAQYAASRKTVPPRTL